MLSILTGLVVRGFFVHNGRARPAAATYTPSHGGSVRLDPGLRATAQVHMSGFEHTVAGARAAAVAYVLTGQHFLDLAPAQVPAAVRAISASGSADAQVADAERELEQLRALLASGTGPTRYFQAVLATRVDAFAPERARVSVWSVGVLSRAGVANPQAGWDVSTFDLVWERADWKIWSETITPGPAPTLNTAAAPATSEQLDQALIGFAAWTSSR